MASHGLPYPHSATSNPPNTMIAKRLTCLLVLGLSACSTTEEQVVELLEQMAANPVD